MVEYARDDYIRWLDTLPKARHIVVSFDGRKHVTKVLVAEGGNKPAEKIRSFNDGWWDLSLSQKNGVHKAALGRIKARKMNEAHKVSRAEARLLRIKQQENQHGNR